MKAFTTGNHRHANTGSLAYLKGQSCIPAWTSKAIAITIKFIAEHLYIMDTTVTE